MSRLTDAVPSNADIGPPEERVLTLTPTGRDASLAAAFLTRAGIRTHICPDMAALCRELDMPSGAVLIAEEAFIADALELFRGALAHQAAWSDVPVLLLLGGSKNNARGARLAEALGNATLIHRPARAVILIGAVQRALRARRRQHRLHDHLMDCEAREHSARKAARLEQTLRAQASAAREESEERYHRLLAEHGSGASKVAAVTDTTEYDALQAQVRRQAEQLARMDQRKNAFIAMLAHELRNPLAPIHNAVHVLKIQPDPPEAKHVHWALDVIDRQAQHLTRLADDLLDIARITHGRIQLHKQVVDLTEALSQAAEAARPLLEGRRHRFIFTPPATPLRVHADPTRLAQIAGNLLNNAARYTPPGGNVSLTVRGENDEAVITVHDDGPGIAADALPHIFDLFNQAARTPDDIEGGLGLGLALVHRLVQLHGGRVTAHSEGPGRGSEFNVYLPLSETAGARAPAPGRAVVRGASARILVVDDNKDVAQSFAILLGTMGHTVRAVADGPAALAAVKDFRPSVAFIDIGLPGMDGYELARRLRADYPPATLRLVALTGYGQADTRARAQAAGFDAHVLKPGDVATLEALARERLEKPGST